LHATRTPRNERGVCFVNQNVFFSYSSAIAALLIGCKSKLSFLRRKCFLLKCRVFLHAIYLHLNAHFLVHQDFVGQVGFPDNVGFRESQDLQISSAFNGSNIFSSNPNPCYAEAP
jgi:hypothetical protein